MTGENEAVYITRLECVARLRRIAAALQSEAYRLEAAGTVYGQATNDAIAAQIANLEESRIYPGYLNKDGSVIQEPK
jgi:hypothetical protein